MMKTLKHGEAPAERKVYRVSELNRSIKSVLETEFKSLWVEGEVSNFKHHSSGHIYFSLKDEKSQINCVFFSRYNQSLRFDLEDGLKVIVYGRISVYEPRGQYQVFIEKALPKGMGELQLAFLQLKEKLEKEGLFHEDRKRLIPKFPAIVGVVTSPTGAAFRDILNVIHRRFRGTEVLLAPVKVQGEGASEEIVEGIEMLNKVKGLDVMIVGRGGGSLEDLWAFNEEIVARAVFKSRVPVISAVGHEIDWTICDLVADVRAPTPSAAAEIVVQNSEEIQARLSEYSSRMRLALENGIESRRSALEGLLESYALKQPLNLVQQNAQRLDELSRQLQNYLKALIAQKRHGLSETAGKLHALSPLAILERGYSITLGRGGRLLKNAAKIKLEDIIETRLASGTLESKVTKISPEGTS